MPGFLGNRVVNFLAQFSRVGWGIKPFGVEAQRALRRKVVSAMTYPLMMIGIGVIVAVTALELKDACETMKDLHALDIAFNPAAANDANEICGQAVPTKGEIIDSVMESPSKAWNAATETVSDLPSWGEALAAAKRKAWEMLEWMKILLGF